MVRHTLKSLGPKVLADRMVRDYVTTLYTPAAGSSRTLNGDYAGAQELAAWKKRTREGLERRGHRPRRVQRCRGRPRARRHHRGAGVRLPRRRWRPTTSTSRWCTAGSGHDDELVDTTAESLAHAETYEGGRHRFEGDVALATTGPFGYTVRVLPRNDHLAGPAELGRVTYPPS